MEYRIEGKERAGDRMNERNEDKESRLTREER
jgi:hypothetical protein